MLCNGEAEYRKGRALHSDSKLWRGKARHVYESSGSGRVWSGCVSKDSAAEMISFAPRRQQQKQWIRPVR